jgi:hypothetical protein
MIQPVQTAQWPAGTTRLRPDEYRFVSGRVAGRGLTGADQADLSALGRELAGARREARSAQSTRAQEAVIDAARGDPAARRWTRLEPQEDAGARFHASGRRHSAPRQPASLGEATPQARLAAAEAAARHLRLQDALESADLPSGAWLDAPQIVDYWV